MTVHLQDVVAHLQLELWALRVCNRKPTAPLRLLSGSPETTPEFGLLNLKGVGLGGRFGSWGIKERVSGLSMQDRARSGVQGPGPQEDEEKTQGSDAVVFKQSSKTADL